MDRRSFLKIFGLGAAASVAITKVGASELTNDCSINRCGSINTKICKFTDLQSDFNKVNRERINDIISASFSEAVQLHRFEINDTLTRSSITNYVTEILRQLYNSRQIYSYNVTCDECNNITKSINAGIINMDVNYSNDKIHTNVIRLVATVTTLNGVSFHNS